MSGPILTYFENLAATGLTCPHPDAFEPDGVKIYYRLLKSDQAVSEHFLPTPLRPGIPVSKDCDACIQKSVSVYDNLPGMINGFFKTPAGKNKKYYVGHLKLQLHDGMLKRTFGPGHHSWWRSTAFDVSTVIIQEL